MNNITIVGNTVKVTKNETKTVTGKNGEFESHSFHFTVADNNGDDAQFWLCQASGSVADRAEKLLDHNTSDGKHKSRKIGVVGKVREYETILTLDKVPVNFNGTEGTLNGVAVKVKAKAITVYDLQVMDANPDKDASATATATATFTPAPATASNPAPAPAPATASNPAPAPAPATDTEGMPCAF